MTFLNSIQHKIWNISASIYIPIIMLFAIFFRVIFTPWGLSSEASDTIVFFIEAYNYSHGDFSQFNSRFLWPLFLSGFFVLFGAQEYQGYVDLMRIISISISVITIPLVFAISRMIVDKKFAILATIFFAFDINIIENATWTLTEPLFLLLGLLSIYFILNQNSHYYVLSFVFAALSFDTRLNGIVIFILVVIGCFLKIRPKKLMVYYLLIGIAIFITITIPHYYNLQNDKTIPVLNRVSETVGNFNQTKINPHLYEIAKIFHPSYDSSNNEFGKEITTLDVYVFSIIKELYHLVLISIPFFVFLVPIGIFVILKRFSFDKAILLAAITLTLIVAIPQYTLSAEYRNLLFLVPIFAIISVIGIQNVVKDKKIENFVIIGLIIGMILFSYLSSLERMPDTELLSEQEKFGKYVTQNYEGIIAGDMTYYIENQLIVLTDIPLRHNTDGKIATTYSFFSITSKDQLFEFVKSNKISYLIVDDKLDNRYPIFQEIFLDEKSYTFLQKVYDSSSDSDYRLLKVKIFKITIHE